MPVKLIALQGGLALPRYELMDGEAMAAENPKTFILPAPHLIDALRPGDFIKAGARFDAAGPKVGPDPKGRALWEKKVGRAAADNVDGERFWVQLTGIADGVYAGVVNNDMVYTAQHGLRLGDKITVQRKHILDVLLEPGEAA